MSKKLTLHHLELIWAKVKSIIPDISDFVTENEVDAKILPVATRVATIEGKESGWDAKYSKPSTGIPKTDLASAVQTSLTKADNALPNTTTHLSGDIATTEKGAANGVASLGSDGKVPSSQLPSYVDDVLEYDSQSSFPATGESGKIYIAKDTNKTYRWSGSAYVEISQSLALGETSSTAYAGNKGKANAESIANIQQMINDITIIRSNASNGAIAYNWGNHASVGYYIKPNNGISKTDLATNIQTSLEKADSSIQNIKTINGQSIIGTGNIDIQPGTNLPLSVVDGLLCITYNN